MKEFLYKLRFSPLILGVITLMIGAGVKISIPGADVFGIIYYGAFGSIGGFIFLQAMRQWNSEKNEPGQHLEPAITEQNIWNDKQYSLKDNLPFWIVRAGFSFITALLGLSITRNNLMFGGAIFIVGTLICVLHIYWIVQNISALRLLSPKCSSSNTICIREIEIKGFGRDEIPVIRILNNNTSRLIFEIFPPENKKLTQEQTENLPAVLSNLTGAEVLHEDRESFLILSSDPEVIDKIVAFIGNY